MPLKFSGKVLKDRPPKRTEVSIKAETYVKLKAAAEKEGISVVELLDRILSSSGDLQE